LLAVRLSNPGTLIVDAPLDAVAIRVLGSLIEKAVTTPDYYPLSLNALVAACNQTSNRDPVLTLDEQTVSRSLDDLRRRSLVRSMQRIDSRVTKYEHLAAETLNLSDAELAVMCVLMLRGPQTGGEIKTRTNRLFEFDDLAQVEATLDALIAREPSSLAARLPRRPGQKELRCAHLLSGDVQPEVTDVAVPRRPPDAERLDALEHATEALRTELDELRAHFEQFKRQFEA
jgi:uncharacterized protein YceH (UPF0502 family)